MSPAQNAAKGAFAKEQITTDTVVLQQVTTLPSTRVLNGIRLLANSTGTCIVFHSTGTTWLYASSTSVQPS